jgi:hypothetical protein
VSYSQYQGRSFGRIMHFVHVYCGLNAAEYVTFSTEYSVTLHGKPFATYHWERDVPVFVFEEPAFNEAQERLRAKAIEKSLPQYPNNAQGWMVDAIEAFRNVGMGDPAQSYCNDQYPFPVMGGIIARSMIECCKRLEHRINGDPRVETRDDYLRAVECGTRALREIGLIP